jgi:hypothetical protein
MDRKGLAGFKEREGREKWGRASQKRQTPIPTEVEMGAV